MPIAKLYNASNVVVGEAACLIAPAFTPVPNIAKASLTDPFDLTLWDYSTVQASTTVSSGTFTLTYTLNGVAYTTASQTATTVTAAALAAAIVTAMAALGVAASDVTVTGGPVSATATPFLISLAESFTGGVWTLTPTTIVGGPLVVTSGLWTPVGATDQGWRYSSAKTTQDIMIEEQTTPVNTTLSSQKFTIEGVLSEDISRTLAVVFNMLNTYTANGSGTAGYETLALSDTIVNYAVALIMSNSLGYARWLYIPSTTCLANVDVTLRRAAAKHMYSAQFNSVCATSLIKIFNVLQAGT